MKQETVSDSGSSWAICKFAPHSRQITTPAPHHSVFTGRMPFLPPNQQRQSSQGTKHVFKTCKQLLNVYTQTQWLAIWNADGYQQWCVAKNGGGYMQRGVAKGLKVPCLFMITEVSIRCQKNPEVGIRRIPAYTPQYTTGYQP